MRESMAVMLLLLFAKIDYSNSGSCEELLMLRRTDLLVIPLDGPTYPVSIISNSWFVNSIAIDYDPVEQFVYWTDGGLKIIQKMHRNGAGRTVIINTGVSIPNGIAVDWSARKLYWTDAGTFRIEAALLDGSQRTVIIQNTNASTPRAIALDPAQRTMYWTAWGTTPSVERAAMDGSLRTVLINTSIVWPNGLALDLQARLLYWGDAFLDKIEVASLLGSDRRILFSAASIGTEMHIFGFDIIGDYIYWSDRQESRVWRLPKSGGLFPEALMQLPNLMGITAVSVVSNSSATAVLLEKKGTCWNANVQLANASCNPLQSLQVKCSGGRPSHEIYTDTSTICGLKNGTVYNCTAVAKFKNRRTNYLVFILPKTTMSVPTEDLIGLCYNKSDSCLAIRISIKRKRNHLVPWTASYVARSNNVVFLDGELVFFEKDTEVLLTCDASNITTVEISVVFCNFSSDCTTVLKRVSLQEPSQSCHTEQEAENNPQPAKTVYIATEAYIGIIVGSVIGGLMLVSITAVLARVYWMKRNALPQGDTRILYSSDLSSVRSEDGGNNRNAEGNGNNPADLDINLYCTISAAPSDDTGQENEAYVHLKLPARDSKDLYAVLPKEWLYQHE